MKGKLKMVLKVIIIMLIVLCILLLIAFINHKIKSEKEKTLLKPIGQLVEVDGRNMCVYIDGLGDKTIVFLSGGGIASPVYDFKSLYTQLTDEYKIAVVEKVGYGFSDDDDRKRDIDTILEDTRTALIKAGLEAPYVLCPHSMSGLEALYWVQKYPEEVEAIIGLDMAVPEYYTDMNISIATLKFNQVLCDMGLVRLISDSYINTLYADANLAASEKDIVKALYSRRCVSTAFVNEGCMCKENAQTVSEGAIPQIPVLMFISNGERINLDKEMWINTAKEYASHLDNGKYIELDCPHNIHTIEYQVIATEIKKFLEMKTY